MLGNNKGVFMSVLDLLHAPIKAEWVNWRVTRANVTDRGAAAYVVPYIRAHAVRELLNKVVGPENWMAEYSEMPSGAIICRLSIKVRDAWVHKEDCSGIRGAMQEKENQLKGGYSDAFKRAARAWGIGDNLATVGEMKVPLTERQTGDKNERFHSHKDKSNARRTYFYWVPPKLPAGQTITEESWNQAAKEASLRYAAHLVEEREAPKIGADVTERLPEPEEAPEPTHDAAPAVEDVEDLPDEDLDEDQVDVERYPLETEDESLVNKIDRQLEKARGIFSSSKFGNKALALRDFQKNHPVDGFKIKSPEQTKAGWRIYCQPADIQNWIKSMRGWEK